MAYTTSAGYETYFNDPGSAPSDYDRQDMLATTLFKAVYPNFPSETQYADLNSTLKTCIANAIYEQIKLAVDSPGLYEGKDGESDSFSVGNFSISGGDNSQSGRVGFMAKSYLDACGVSYKGVGGCSCH